MLCGVVRTWPASESLVEQSQRQTTFQPTSDPSSTYLHCHRTPLVCHRPCSCGFSEDQEQTMTNSVRLHTKAVHLGYMRNRLNQNCAQSRLQIEGVKDRKDAQFYMGKRVAYVYKAQTLKKASSGKLSKYRVMWGRIIAPHGNGGHVRAKFRKNLPPNSIGKGVRVMLYPSTI